MDNVFARYYQQSTYNHDYNKSPRGNPTYGNSSPRGGYHPDSHPREERYFREAPREFRDNQEPRRSPHHSPISPRRQPPLSDRSDRRGYEGMSPPPMLGSNSPRRYPHYDMSRDDLPPMNTYAINSTTQHDYGDFNTRTTQKEYGDFAQKQLMISDIRARGDPELARRYDGKYDSRPYFDDKDPPSFHRDLPLTDRSGYDVDRRAPRLDAGPLTDRSERGRRSQPMGSSPLPPDHALNEMARGQMKKELDRIELHEGNFKPYSHHNLGGGERQVITGPIAHHKRLYERPPSKGPGVLSRPIAHELHRYEDDLMKTTSPRRSQIMHQREVRQKLPMHDYHRFEQVHKTDNPERVYPEPKQGHKNPAGVFLFLRTDEDGFDDVKLAFEQFTGDTPTRRLLGIARSHMIDVKEGGAGWQKQAVLARWNGQYYNEERRGPVEKMLAVQWFPVEQKAREWINMDRKFKDPKFPWPYGSHTSVLPLRYQPSSAKGHNTFMLMEFNNVTDKNELRKYIDYMCKEMSRYNAEIAFIDTAPVGVKSPLFEYGSHIVCHTFCNRKEADLCFGELMRGRHFQHADVTITVFSLLDIMRK